jgi:hypothetical protein
MGVPTSEVGYTSATTGRGDHEVHKGHVVALANNTYSEREKEEEVDEVESILQSVEHSPTKCTRKISTDFGVPHKRKWRTLRQRGLYPFRLQMVKRLEEGDKSRPGVDNLGQACQAWNAELFSTAR